MVRSVLLVIALLACVAPTLILRRGGCRVFQAARTDRGGWCLGLALFMLYALYLGPLFVLALVLGCGSEEMDTLFAGALQQHPYALYLCFLLLGIFAGLSLSIRAGILAARHAPRARKRIRVLLTARILLEGTCCCALPYLLLPASLAASLVNATAGGVLASVLIQGAWVAWFALSRQAAALLP